MLVKTILKKKKIAITVFVVVFLFLGSLLPYAEVHDKLTMFKLREMVLKANAISSCPTPMGGNVTVVQPCTVQDSAGSCGECCTVKPGPPIGNGKCALYNKVEYVSAGGATEGPACALKGLAGVDGSQIEINDGIVGCHTGMPDVLEDPMSFATSGLVKNNKGIKIDSGVFRKSILFALVQKIFNRG